MSLGSQLAALNSSSGSSSGGGGLGAQLKALNSAPASSGGSLGAQLRALNGGGTSNVLQSGGPKVNVASPSMLKTNAQKVIAQIAAERQREARANQHFSLGGALGNFGSDLYGAAVGIPNLVKQIGSHGYDAVQAAGQLATGHPSEALHTFEHPYKMDEAIVKGLYNQYRQAYGGALSDVLHGNLKDAYWQLSHQTYNHPLNTFLDLTAAVGAAGKVADAGEIAGNVARAARVADAATGARDAMAFSRTEAIANAIRRTKYLQRATDPAGRVLYDDSGRVLGGHDIWGEANRTVGRRVRTSLDERKFTVKLHESGSMARNEIVRRDRGWSANPIVRELVQKPLTRGIDHILRNYPVNDPAVLGTPESRFATMARRFHEFSHGLESGQKALEHFARDKAGQAAAHVARTLRATEDFRPFIKYTHKVAKDYGEVGREALGWHIVSDGKYLDTGKLANYIDDLEKQYRIKSMTGVDPGTLRHIEERIRIDKEILSRSELHSPADGSNMAKAVEAAKGLIPHELAAGRKALGMDEQAMYDRALRYMMIAGDHKITLPDLRYYSAAVDRAYQALPQGIQEGGDALSFVRNTLPDQIANQGLLTHQASQLAEELNSQANMGFLDPDAQLRHMKATEAANQRAKYEEMIHAELKRQAHEVFGMPKEDIAYHELRKLPEQDPVLKNSTKAKLLEQRVRNYYHDLNTVHGLAYGQLPLTDIIPIVARPTIGAGFDQVSQAMEDFRQAVIEHVQQQGLFQKQMGSEGKYVHMALYDAPVDWTDHSVNRVEDLVPPSDPALRDQAGVLTPRDATKINSKKLGMKMFRTKQTVVPQAAHYFDSTWLHAGTQRLNPLDLANQYIHNLRQVEYNKQAIDIVNFAAMKVPVKGSENHWQIDQGTFADMNKRYGSGMGMAIVNKEAFLQAMSRVMSSEDWTDMKDLINATKRSEAPAAAEVQLGSKMVAAGTGGDYIAIPQSVIDGWKASNDAFATHGWAGRQIDRLTSYWKDAVLALSPRWYIHVTLGHTMQYLMGAGPQDGHVIAWSLGPEMRRVMETETPEITNSIYHEANTAQSALTKLYQFNDRIQTRIRMSMGVAAARKIARDEGLTQITSKMSDAQMAAAFQKLMDNPVHRAAVLDEALTFIGDYTHFSDFEKTYIRRYFPFYSWLRTVARLVVKMPLHHPLTAWAVATLGRHANEALNPGDPGLSASNRGMLMAGDNLGFDMGGANPLNDLKTWGEGLASPGSSWNKLLATAGGITGTSDSPFASTAEGMLTGINSFTGAPYTAPTNYGGGAASFGGTPLALNDLGEYQQPLVRPGLIQSALGLIPQESTLRTLLQTGMPGHAYDTTSDPQLIWDQIQKNLGGGLSPSDAANDFMPPSKIGGTGVRTPTLSALASLLGGMNVRDINWPQVAAYNQYQQDQAAKAQAATASSMAKSGSRLAGSQLPINFAP